MSLVVVPYSPERHKRWVITTFAISLTDAKAPQWPWRMMDRRALTNELEHILRQPGVVAKVAEVHDGAAIDFEGIVIARPAANEVVWAYTKHAFRRMGVCCRLLVECGLNLNRHVPLCVRYFTRATERISRRPGWENLRFTVLEEEAA